MPPDPLDEYAEENRPPVTYHCDGGCGQSFTVPFLEMTNPPTPPRGWWLVEIRRAGRAYGSNRRRLVDSVQCAGVAAAADLDEERDHAAAMPAPRGARL